MIIGVFTLTLSNKTFSNIFYEGIKLKFDTYQGSEKSSGSELSLLLIEFKAQTLREKIELKFFSSCARLCLECDIYLRYSYQTVQVHAFLAHCCMLQLVDRLARASKPLVAIIQISNI